MLKRKYRLPASVRFSKNDTISTKFYLLKTAPNNLSYSRVGFVISKKVDKRAVARNRLKRKMTNFIEKVIEKIVGYDMLFILKKEAILGVNQLDKTTSDVLKKKGILA